MGQIWSAVVIKLLIISSSKSAILIIVNDFFIPRENRRINRLSNSE